MRIWSIVAVLIVAVVAHESVRSQSAAPHSLAKDAIIGVAALLPDELHLRYEGPTVFQNRYHMDKVPDWAIAEFTAEATATILGRLRSYRFEALTLNFVAPTNNPVFVAAEQRGIDTVVVIRHRENPSPDHYEGGYGLLIRKKSWLGRQAGTQCAFSWLVIEVWDVPSRDRLEKQEALNCDRDERIEIRDRYADYSSAEQAQIESLVKTSLLRSAESAVSELEVFQQ